MKNLSWIIVPLALLTLAPATVSAGQAVEKTKDAVVKDAKIVGNKTKEGLSKTGEVMTDAWITTRIHERFVGEDLLKGSDISVDTAQHVVTLKGTVVEALRSWGHDSAPARRGSAARNRAIDDSAYVCNRGPDS